jgi:hypothetical protein
MIERDKKEGDFGGRGGIHKKTNRLLSPFSFILGILYSGVLNTHFLHISSFHFPPVTLPPQAVLVTFCRLGSDTDCLPLREIFLFGREVVAGIFFYYLP